MSKYRKALGAAALAGLLAGPVMAEPLGLGRDALPEEIAAWNLDVAPDGTGLPEGQGSVADGEVLFAEGCGSCHGVFAEGVGNWPKLAGGDGTLADADPVKTVGSYWPYLSTAFDYVHRSMPFGNAQSLTVDETYAMVAYILYSNFLVDEDFVLSHENFLEVEMPNADGFFVDDRPEVEYPQWRTEPCMQDCKESVEITTRATVLDVTPEETAAKAQAAEAQAEAGAAEPEVQTARFDAELAAEGEAVFGKCRACHQVGEGARNRVGPHLNDIVGRDIGGLDGFRYSNAMAEYGGVWDEATLAAFLENPRGTVQGTKMAFAGLKKEDDVAAVIEYLKSASVASQ